MSPATVKAAPQGASIELTLGPYKAQGRLDFNTLARVEMATGESALAAEFWVDAASARRVRAIVWAVLVGQHPGVTIEEVGSLLTPREFARLASGIEEMAALAMPEADDEEPEDEAPGEAPAARA